MTAVYFLVVIIAIGLVFAFGPRPRLNPTAGGTLVPSNLSMKDLDAWLIEAEATVPDLTPGAEASITFANPGAPEKTPLSFLYLHGFSATRQETAPVTENIAGHFGGNVVHVRLAGHGVGPAGMETPSESWLQSTLDAYTLAAEVGDKVVVIGTSTGATLAVWLAAQNYRLEQLKAFLFMAPNFKVRNPFAFLLTWPFAETWVPWLLGRERKWEPENEMAAKYWTHSYSTQALIEMQKVVDWCSKVNLATLQVPLALMYMKNDPTVNSDAAIAAFERWGARDKKLLQVTIDPEEASHVFVGDITNPHRTDWCVEQFTTFLESLEANENER